MEFKELGALRRYCNEDKESLRPLAAAEIKGKVVVTPKGVMDWRENNLCSTWPRLPASTLQLIVAKLQRAIEDQDQLDPLAS